MLEVTNPLDYREFTGTRTGDKETKAPEPRRESVSFNETRLLSLYICTAEPVLISGILLSMMLL